MSSTVPRHPGPLHHPRRREGVVEGEAEVEAEAGDAAGTTTMEARPGVGVAAAVEGDVVAVGVGVGVAAASPSTSAHGSRRIATTDGTVGRRCPSTFRGAPHCRHHAYQYRHDGLQGWRRTGSLSHVLAFFHPQHGLKRHGDVLGRPNVQMPRRKRRPRRRRSQRGGVSPGLITGIFKTAHKTTKAIGEHQQKNAEKISRKRRAEVASGKRKKYAGESFNCPIM